MKVAITGATGFVGSRLVDRLQEEGDTSLILTRDAAKAKRLFPERKFPNLYIVEYTPTESGTWQQALSSCDAVVNLAGAPIADEHWTPQRRKIIRDSRIVGTEKIVEAISQANPKPQVLVNASAIGYYGTSETATFEENSQPGDDFLASVCTEWESAAETVKNLGVRLVILRFGIVLGRGGALGKMLMPFQLFAGGPLGSGRQWFSWIHRDDLVNLIIFSWRQIEIEGTYNATAPHPVRMKEFCQNLGKVLQRPSWLPVPSFALEMLLGDAAKVVLEGQQVLPKRTLATRFEYQYPTVKPALEEILGK